MSGWANENTSTKKSGPSSKKDQWIEMVFRLIQKKRKNIWKQFLLLKMLSGKKHCVYFIQNSSELTEYTIKLWSCVLHQVLHRPQNKEKLTQNNFEAPVWQLKMVFECSIAWCDLGLGRATVHCQRNHPRKPKFSRNRAILSDHFSGVKFYNGLFLDRPFFGSASAFFSTVRCSWRSSVLRGFR